MEENRSNPDHKVPGVDHEEVDEAKTSPPTNFTMSKKHVTCCVDLTPLVKEDELNYVRLRYNEFLLQCVSGPFDLDSNLDQRHEQVKNGEHDICRLRDEIDRTEAERRNSEQKLAHVADGHQQRVNELESDVASLRAEMAQLKDGGVGAGVRQQIMKEVDGALFELGQLESGVELRRKRLQELESEACRKDEQLIRTRQELEDIKSILQTVDKDSEEKISQLKDSISSKEMEQHNFRLEMEALKACKSKLQNDLVSTQKEAQELKDNVHEKDKIISFYKTDNQKITEELEGLRQLLNQNEQVAQKEMDDAAKNEQNLSEQVHSVLSSKEEDAIKEKLASLEKEVQQKRLVCQQNKSVCQAMDVKIKQALDAVDVSEDRLKTLVAETQTIRESSARTIQQLQTQNRDVEQALEEMKMKAENVNMADGSGVGQAVRQGLDSVLDTLKKTDKKVSDYGLIGPVEQKRLLSTLDAVDKTLSQAEEIVQSRSTSVDVQLSEPEQIPQEEGLFLRYYPLILTGLFLVLVVGGNIFFNSSGWSIWLPYFVLAALSFALPHPYGAVATLLVALVVAASSIV